MGATKISYCNESWNVTVGCTHANMSGCDNCWAKDLHDMRHKAYLLGKKIPIQYARPFGEIRLRYDRIDEPLHWRKPRRIFVCAMSDLFHPQVPFAYIDMVMVFVALCPQHDFLFFTKRIKRAAEYLDGKKRNTGSIVMKESGLRGRKYNPNGSWPLPNLQLIVSCSTQKELDENAPILLQVPVAVRGISLEPLIEEINLERYLLSCKECGNQGSGPIFDFLPPGNGKSLCRDVCIKKGEGPSLDWVIVGCEKIHNKPGRFCEDEAKWWAAARLIFQQCKDTGIAFYMKQGPINGKVVTDIEKFPEDLRIREYPRGYRKIIGKECLTTKTSCSGDA
jgi:protein gp37